MNRQRMAGGMWQRLTVVAVAVVCLLTTLAAWRYAEDTSRRVEELEFERAARRIERALVERLNHLETAVRAAQAFASGSRPTAEGWARFVDTLRLNLGRNGVVGLVYYEPAGGEADGWAITLGAPEERLRPLIGMKVDAFPEVRRALVRAATTGEPSLSQPFEDPLRAAGREVAADVVLVGAVGSLDGTVDSTHGRSLVGVGIDADGLMRGILGSASPDLVVRVTDGGVSPDSPMLYGTGDFDAEGSLLHVAALTVGGRVWGLMIGAAPRPEVALIGRDGSGVAAFGLLFTVAMTLATWLLVTRRMRAEALARSMTEALKDSEERYRMLFEANKAVELLIDPSDGRIVDANAAAAAFYGWSVDELKARRITDINTLSADAVKAEMDRADREARSHFVFRHRLANGSERDVEVHAGPVIVSGQRLLYSIIHDITQRVEAQRALRDSEIRFRALFEQSPWATLVLDRRGRIRRANPAWLALWAEHGRRGPEPGTLMDDAQLVRAGLPDLIRRAAAGEPVEAPMVAFDGGRFHAPGGAPEGEPVTRWLRVFLYPLRDGAGRVEEVILVAEDITGRVIAERLLRYRHRLLAAQLQTTPDGVVVMDERWRMESFNQRFVEMWGLPATTVAACDGAGALAHMCAMVQTPGVFERRMRNGAEDALAAWDEVALRDGRVFEVHGGDVPAADGEPARRVWFYRDITERKSLEARLRRALEEQDAIFNSAGEGIALVAGDRFVRTNRKFNDLFGYSGEELDTLRPSAMFPDTASRDALFEKAQTAMRQRGTYTGEHPMRRKDGSIFWCRTTGARLDRSEGRGTIWVLEDVTERRRAEGRMNRLLTELERSNAELQQFAYVASHDLQEPLRMVSSYMGLLEKRYGTDLPQDAKEFIGYAVDGAHRMQGLINDLLQYSRVGTRGQPLAPTDAAVAVQEALANLRMAIADSGAVVSVEALPSVMADSGQLVRLFQNLIGNALKYHDATRPPEVRVWATREAEGWHFRVADNGIGIAPEHRDRVFMIFQRLHTRTEYTGTGIGLAICKKIVERHGGRIWVDDTPGGGATFHFTLEPVEPGETGAARHPEALDA